jgi:hypothetical protein
LAISRIRPKLEHYGIQAVADVRRFSRSWRLLQFMSAGLEAALANHRPPMKD